MGFSTEDIPTITASVMLAYATFRLILTIIKKGKQSIFRYWSRFLFRLFFIFHNIFYLLTTISKYNGVQAIKYISQGSLPFALAFLVVSIQDFVCYSNRDPTFIKRNWICLDIPFLVAMVEDQIMLWYGQNNHDDYVVRTCQILYEIFLDIFIIALIVIPAIFFLVEIRKTDFSDSLKTKTILAMCFFVLLIVLLFICSFFGIYSVVGGDLYTVARTTAIIFKSSRDPVMIMVCFTQDMVDWMLKWIYLDEDAIFEDSDEPKRQDPSAIEIDCPDL